MSLTANAENNDEVGVALIEYAVSLEYPRKNACHFRTDAQDYTWHENCKGVQLIDLN